MRCIGGSDGHGCIGCECDGLGNHTICTLRGCSIDELGPYGCTRCEIGYTLNNATNTCDSGI